MLDTLTGAEASRRSGRSLLATLSTQVGRFCLQIASTILLARLLPPEDFGLIAMVLVLTNLVGTFRDAGLTQATVQAESIEHSQVNALFWLNVGLCLVLFLLVALAAPLLVWIYDEPRLFWLTIALGLTIALSGPGLQHLALLQRNLKFGKIARADLLAQALALGVGLTAALYGAGYWSIAWMAIAQAASNTLLLTYLSDWRPKRPKWSSGLRPFLSFGGHLTGFTFANYFARNADNFLIGKFLGPGALGQYSRAYQLMLLPIQQINGPIAAALIPTLSRLQNQPIEFAALYLKWAGRIAWVTAIPIASMVYFGEKLVVFLLGEKWQLAGELFQWLALASVLQPLSNFMGVCFIATGQTRRMFHWGLVSSGLIVCGFLFGLIWGGVQGLVITYALIANLLFPLLVHYCIGQTPVSIDSYYRQISCPTLIALTISLVALYL